MMPKKEQREKLLAAIDRYVQETPTRVPLCDWYQTADAKQSGFQARSVVGGVFILLMDDPNVWKKWSTAAQVATLRAAGRRQSPTKAQTRRREAPAGRRSAVGARLLLSAQSPTLDAPRPSAPRIPQAHPRCRSSVSRGVKPRSLRSISRAVVDDAAVSGGGGLNVGGSSGSTVTMGGGSDISIGGGDSGGGVTVSDDNGS